MKVNVAVASQGKYIVYDQIEAWTEDAAMYNKGENARNGACAADAGGEVDVELLPEQFSFSSRDAASFDFYSIIYNMRMADMMNGWLDQRNGVYRFVTPNFQAGQKMPLVQEGFHLTKDAIGKGKFTGANDKKCAKNREKVLGHNLMKNEWSCTYPFSVETSVCFKTFLGTFRAAWVKRGQRAPKDGAEAIEYGIAVRNAYLAELAIKMRRQLEWNIAHGDLHSPIDRMYTILEGIFKQLFHASKTKRKAHAIRLKFYDLKVGTGLSFKTGVKENVISYTGDMDKFLAELNFAFNNILDVDNFSQAIQATYGMDGKNNSIDLVSKIINRNIGIEDLKLVWTGDPEDGCYGDVPGAVIVDELCKNTYKDTPVCLPYRKGWTHDHVNSARYLISDFKEVLRYNNLNKADIASTVLHVSEAGATALANSYAVLCKSEGCASNGKDAALLADENASLRALAAKIGIAEINPNPFVIGEHYAGTPPTNLEFNANTRPSDTSLKIGIGATGTPIEGEMTADAMNYVGITIKEYYKVFTNLCAGGECAPNAVFTDLNEWCYGSKPIKTNCYALAATH